VVCDQLKPGRGVVEFFTALSEGPVRAARRSRRSLELTWPGRAVQPEAVQEAPALAERQERDPLAVELEQVERDEHAPHAPVPLEHPPAEQREARPAVLTEGDQFPVEDRVDLEAGELCEVAGHVPAAAAAHLEPVAGADDRAEPVQLQL